MYTLPRVKPIASRKLHVTQGTQFAVCDVLKGWDAKGREAREGGAMCIHKAESVSCTAETNIF